jgi:hypothetical protein
LATAGGVHDLCAHYKRPWLYRGNVCIEIKHDAQRITVRVDQDALDDVDQTIHDDAARLRSAEKHMEMILSAAERKSLLARSTQMEKSRSPPPISALKVAAALFETRRSVH